MRILDRRHLMKLTAAGLGSLAAGPSAAAPASAEVFMAGPEGARVGSVMVLGERGAVLIDAQFTAPEARRLARALAATGRTLETIFVTHLHPDHWVGLPVILSAFPGARVVTHPAIRPALAETAEPTLTWLRGGQVVPAAAIPAGPAVVPEALDGPLTLEGERIEVLDPVRGDTALVSMVHVPALDTLVASDVVFAGTHLWTRETTTPEAIAGWRAGLDAAEAVGAGTIVPGHLMAGAPGASDGIAHSRAYLDRWERALAEARDAAELRERMMRGGEGLGLGFALDFAVAEVFQDG